jgi:hypothetical protein
MRRLILTAIFVALPWAFTSKPTTMHVAPATAVAADPAPNAPDAPKAPAIDVNVNRTEKHVVWFADPMMLAVIGGGVLLLVLFVAMASRGGGTTIIKEK